MNLRITLVCISLISLIGCQAGRQSLTLIPVVPPEAEQQDNASDSDIPSPPSNAVLSYDNSPELKTAMKQFVSSGKAPIIKRAGFVQFPFGEVQPVLNCQPNYGCDIELEPGEQVKAVILGNEPMWDYMVWESNQQQVPLAHITIGPRISSERTNVIIGTDRRTYHLELLSTTKSEYTRSAKFYYPRERLREFQKDKKRQESREAAGRSGLALQRTSSLPYQYVSFGWEIEANSDITWTPIRVFDDGVHIYIQFPEQVVFEDFPGIYTPAESGKLTQPVWRAVQPVPGKSREKGQYLMVDGMYEELRLMGGPASNQQTVIIRRKH